MFTAIGVFGGRSVSVTWSDGKLIGDTYAVVKIRNLASDSHGKEVGPGHGPTTLRDHLKSPMSALMLIDEVLDEIIEVEGDKPRMQSSDEVHRSEGRDPAKHRPMVF